MNRDLIKKYKAEFEHWLNGGELLYSYIDDKLVWKSIDEICKYVYPVYRRNPFQISEYHIIIINDEFVEFRKALAEGKVVQYNFGNYGINRKDFPNIWKDLDLSIGILADRACPENYRIKPEEPQFKVGDWVVNKTSKQRIIKKVTSVYSDTVTVGNSTVGINAMLIKDLELWQPKKGEWCWFSIKNRIPTIGQFLSIETDGNRKYSATFPNTPHPFISYYDYCEPFLGQLPTNIQEAL